MYLIFDFDGVLGDTYNVWTEVQTKMNLTIGDSSKPFVDLKTFSARKPIHNRGHTLTDEEMGHIYERVVAGGKLVHETGFSLFTNFITEIKKLPLSKKAVISSGSQLYVLPALIKTDIEFTHILAYEDHHSKEEKIELVCRDWGVTVDSVYYFTDTLADVYELQNLINKDKLIGVAWGYCSKEQLLTELEPENILNTPTDLPKLLAR